MRGNRRPPHARRLRSSRTEPVGAGIGAGYFEVAAMIRRVGFAVLATFAAVSMTPAQPPYDVKANYVKREVYIPMRDGVKLFTILYSPRATTERYPMLMTRTAYGIGPYGPDSYRAILGPNNEFAKEGYIFVYQ